MTRTTPESEIDRLAERVKNQFEVETGKEYDTAFNKMLKLEEKELTNQQKVLRKKSRQVFFRRKVFAPEKIDRVKKPKEFAKGVKE